MRNLILVLAPNNFLNFLCSQYPRHYTFLIDVSQAYSLLFASSMMSTKLVFPLFPQQIRLVTENLAFVTLLNAEFTCTYDRR